MHKKEDCVEAFLTSQPARVLSGLHLARGILKCDRGITVTHVIMEEMIQSISRNRRLRDDQPRPRIFRHIIVPLAMPTSLYSNYCFNLYGYINIIIL